MDAPLPGTIYIVLFLCQSAYETTARGNGEKSLNSGHRTPFVGNGKDSPILLKNSVALWPLECRQGVGFMAAVGTEASPSCGLSGDRWTERKHRQFAKVLGGCGQRKFVARAGWTA